MRHPVVSYFAMTFAISWMAALLVAVPRLLRHEALPQLTGILMFPAMLLGPSVSGIMMTWAVDGWAGLRDLFARMGRWRVGRWYAALLIPPVLVLAVLTGLSASVSPGFAPNRFWLGILFGVPAGLLEEIGWSGYAFPRMKVAMSGMRASVVLGVLWALWHIPVINWLGTVTPHGHYWWPFFLAFGFAMAAMRVLICWLYSETESVLLAQLMHVSSTGALVVFSAPRVSGLQEVGWYAVYGAVLWGLVGAGLKPRVLDQASLRDAVW
jgi:membrane protease YdiL (CAAX protease family)